MRIYLQTKNKYIKKIKGNGIIKNLGLPRTVVQGVPRPKVFDIDASEAEIQLEFSCKAYAST